VCAAHRVAMLHAPRDASARHLWMELFRAIEVLMEVVSAIGPGDDYTMLDGKPVL